MQRNTLVIMQPVVVQSRGKELGIGYVRQIWKNGVVEIADKNGIDCGCYQPDGHERGHYDGKYIRHLFNTETVESVEAAIDARDSKENVLQMAAEQEAKRPVLKLVGTDGNAFAVLGAAHRAAVKAGWSKEQWESVKQEATAGDYNLLLGTMMKHFDVH